MSLADLRTELRDACDFGDAGLTAHLVLPERVAAPALWVKPSDPYLSFEGADFGHVVARLDVVFAVARAVNETTAAEVDRRLMQILAAIPGHFGIEAANPGLVPLSGQDHIGGVVTVLTQIPVESP